jgi:hypothetical protein
MPLAATDTEHAHTCPVPNVLCRMDYETTSQKLLEVLPHVMRQGRVGTSLESLLAALRSDVHVCLLCAQQ